MNNLTATLKEKLQALGIEPKKALGQNFLVNTHVIEKIITAVQKFDAKHIIEIGPGLGALTEHMLAMQNQIKTDTTAFNATTTLAVNTEGMNSSHKTLTLLEWDHLFSQIWKDKGVTVFDGDALVWEGWRELAEKKETILVSNLPYQISSSIVIDRSIEAQRLNGMILMFQKEVAQRIKAVPKTENYGLLSVIAQTFWNVDLLLEAGPRDFFPAPQIASRVLVFKPKEVNIVKPEKFLTWVKVGFSHRRKLLRSNLGSITSNPDILLEKIGVPLKSRAEELSVLQWQNLYNASLVKE